MTTKKSYFRIIEIGNWYTEYQCRKCGEKIVVHADADSTDPEDYHACGK